MSGPRVPNGVNIVDVLAIKPGKMGWDHVIIIAGHIDSRVSDVMDFAKDAPGANDDGSGTAAVIAIIMFLFILFIILFLFLFFFLRNRR